MKNLKTLLALAWVLMLSATLFGQDRDLTVDNQTKIKATGRVTLDIAAVQGTLTEDYTVNQQRRTNRSTKRTTRRTSRTTNRPVQPIVQRRGYNVQIPASQVTANVEMEIDSQQVTRIVDQRTSQYDGRIDENTGAINTLANRLNTFEGETAINFDAVNGRIDQTNSAVNTLANRVNDQDGRITQVEQRKDKTRDWMDYANLALNGVNLFFNIKQELDINKLKRQPVQQQQKRRGGGWNGGGGQYDPCKVNPKGRNCGGNPQPCGRYIKCGPNQTPRINTRVCNGLPCSPSQQGNREVSTDVQNNGAGWNPVNIDNSNRSYTTTSNTGFRYANTSRAMRGNTTTYQSNSNTNSNTNSGGSYRPVRVQ